MVDILTLQSLVLEVFLSFIFLFDIDPENLDYIFLIQFTLDIFSFNLESSPLQTLEFVMHLFSSFYLCRPFKTTI